MPPEVTAQEWAQAYQAAARGGVHYPGGGVRERVSSVVSNIRDRKVFGIPIASFLVDVGVGGVMKYSLKGAVVAGSVSTVGAFGAAVLAGAAVGGLASGGQEYFRQMRENWRQPLPPEAVSRRQKLLERFKDLGPNDLGRLSRATLRGAVVGAAGGLIGAAVADLIAGAPTPPDASHGAAPDVTPTETATPTHTPTVDDLTPSAPTVEATPPESGPTITPTPQETPSPVSSAAAGSADTPTVTATPTHPPFETPSPTETGGPPPPTATAVESSVTATPTATPVDTGSAHVPAAGASGAPIPGVTETQIPPADHQPPVTQPGQPQAAGGGVVVAPAEGVNIPPGEVSHLPPSPTEAVPPPIPPLEIAISHLHDIPLAEGSNPWDVATQILKEVNPDHVPTNSEIMQVTKAICEKSDIGVPEWGIAGSVNHHQIPVNFVLRIDDPDVKSVIGSILKGGR